MQITIYRGAKEIGGSAVEVRTDSGRILLDLGTPLDYDMRGQENRGGAELVASGMLPDICGLYAWDTPAFDAILLSHAHLDHWGFIHFAHPDIPVYLSRGSEILLGVSVQFLHAKPPTGETRVFKMYEPFIIADMHITPYLVDHSAYDAAAFEVEEIPSGGKRVVYTGDFRGHGRKKYALPRFLDGVKPAPDALLCEGTVLGRSGGAVQTEEELEHEISEKLKATDSIALFQCAGQNIDRLVTFCKAAQRSGRTMVIDKYTAAILARLHEIKDTIPSVRTHPNLSIYEPDDPRKMLKLVRPRMARDLAEDDRIRDGVFFYSMWEGYRKQDGQREFEAFLMERGFKITVAHTSGHADIQTLKNVIDRLHPGRVIPIHTFAPERFGELSDRVAIAENGEVIEI